ncbi:S-methyl-5'-thioadenosine phosphorylase [Streptomyces meridianus]|uniref:Purine nucleoside phosphorylase n=1 Tax=Streptomyces meridianus TaxID=2938945 RepID=A0ABT0XB19_9ACTN|nr:S-methyl-5'-thioadenosine phosphorylase [Streptomyces meridianus]MCM2579599.1 S-methyl-5'-thioadenosine phosphorylase [Streptomyces meridianus]
MTSQSAEIAVIGGSGLYALLDKAEEIHPDTPYGKPSDPLTIGSICNRRVAFLPRHGRKHQFAPHCVNYRANLWAIKELGISQVVGIGAVGSLTADIPPGSLVVPDQLVDRTNGRDQTYFEGPNVAHAPFADPYCSDSRHTALEAAERCDWRAVDGGTQVVIQGPRFSTRAESRWYADQGWSIVGMTAHPEVVLARELGLCYIPLCLVTDLDAGVEAGEGVTQEEVMDAFARNLKRLTGVLHELIGLLPPQPNCTCSDLRPAAL